MSEQKRPRRSHQCRGKRARNYVRALARVHASREIMQSSFGHVHSASPNTVLDDARKSGALAAHRRREKQRDEWAQERQHD